MTSVHSVTSHTHDADKFAVEAIKIRTEIMNAADANRGKPGQILADKLLHYPVQVIITLFFYGKNKVSTIFI
jgi:hypothetical protein